MNRRWLMLLSLSPVLAAVGPVEAHASLVRAIPAAGSAVHEAPQKLELWFSEQLEPAFSKVEVLDLAGKRVDLGDPKLDDKDHKLLQISLPRLAAGRYRVAWRVLSIDTHIAKGEFSFDIAAS